MMEGTGQDISTVREQSIFAYNHLYQKAPVARNKAEAEFLQRARYLLEGVMSCDPSHPALKLISSDFQGTHDRCSTIKSMNIQEYLDFVSELKRDHYFIGTRLEISEEWIDFDGTDKAPHATVWRRIEHRRPQEGLVGQGIRIQKWRKDVAVEDGWLCYYFGVFISAPFMSGMTYPSFKV